MKNFSNILWGVVLIVIGLIFGGKAIEAGACKYLNFIAIVLKKKW